MVHGARLDSVTTDLALLVLLLPFAAFLLLAVVTPLRRRGRVAGAISIAAVAASFLAALFIWLAWTGIVLGKFTGPRTVIP